MQRQNIVSVEFGVWSPEEIKRLSVCNVCDPSMYSQQLPVCNGPGDHRMGICDRRLKCGTCKQGLLECPGHFGSINLNFPVYHPGFFDTILKILKSVCFFCSRLLLNCKDIEGMKRVKNRKQKLSYALTCSKSKKKCLHCGGGQPVYSRSGLTIRCDFSKVVFDDPDEERYCCQRTFTAAEARLILQNITAEEVVLLGLPTKTSRPENLILTVLVVPPPIIRPSVIISEGSKARGQDDLTTKICDIVKANINVKNALEKEASSIPHVGLSLSAQQVVSELSFHVGTFMNNDLRGQRQSVQRNGMPSKSLTSRLKGKEGRIRGSLMGKRVNFSARSVVSPDSQMDVDEVGIPYSVAIKLTIPEKVTDFNLDYMCQRIRRGATHGGAISHISNDVVTLMEIADPEHVIKNLKRGDVIERPLEDGDYVIFNRQPSLHKGSMMGYRAKLMPFRTFRLNLSCTSALNGDFDGDELNIHVPQEIDARVEVRSIMAVPLQILSPQANKPIIGLVQDSLIGGWLITKEETVLTRQQMCELKGVLKYCTRQIESKTSFTGRDAVNLLFPLDMEYESKKTNTLIHKGCLIRGQLCKQTIGTASGGIVHHLWLMYSSDCAKNFLSDAQRLLNRWLMWRGFSIRLSDCEPSSSLVEQLTTMLEITSQKVKAIEENDFVNKCLADMKETHISNITNQVLTTVGKYVHASLNIKENSLYQAVVSGSKGNLINMAQLLGLVGQQSVEGKRTNAQKDAYIFGTENTLTEKGFIKNSYFQGLSVTEFFFHAMAGREGLIDTSVKTASTGYLQRRLMKAMESITVSYDKTCRNSRGTIISFEYGADSYNASYLVRVGIPFLKTRCNLSEEFLCDEEAQKFIKVRNKVFRLRNNGLKPNDDVAFVPTMLDATFRMLANLKEGEHFEIEKIPKMVDELISTICGRRWTCKIIQELYLRWHLRTGVLCHYSKTFIQKLFESLRNQTIRAHVPPGESIGALSAQSISEPLTQLTLNTFHMAGVKAKNVTLGVPRVKELIDCTKNIRTAEMKLVVLPAYTDPKMLKFLQASVMQLTLAQCVESSDIVYEPHFFATTFSDLDARLCDIEQLIVDAPPVFNPYLLRIKLNPLLLIQRNLTTYNVASVIESKIQSIHITCSNNSDTNWFLRIRMLDVGVGFTSYEENSNEELNFLRDTVESFAGRLFKDIVLSGIKNVQSACTSQDSVFIMGEDNEIVEKTVNLIETRGSNLKSALSIPQLHGDYCISNDVHDVWNVLGIEAASRVLFEQLQLVLTFDGNYINERHILLLVNVMTSNGYLLPISRHGINRLQDTGVLARASFEEVTDQILEAALYCDTDPCTDFSSHVMLGERARIGTGICQVVRENPAEEDMEEEEEVIFTGGDEEQSVVNIRLPSSSTEMPFAEHTTGRDGHSTNHAFFFSSSSSRSTYAPSSPKNAIEQTRKKRKYTPSSPKNNDEETVNFDNL